MTQAMRTLEENIAKLKEANEETRQVTREAHEAIKTVRLVIRELEAAQEALGAETEKLVERVVEQEVAKGLAAYKDTLKKATAEAHQHVIDEFGKLTNLMMYGNVHGAGRSVIEKWVAKEIHDEIRKIYGLSEKFRL